jgi:hypothetical protein
MKIFLSWSGEDGQKIGETLHAWLPTIIQAAKPYFSSQDIDKGQRWSVDIARELESSDFGIVCVTPVSIKSPWVLFEAGALSKSLDRGRVTPLLFDVKPTDLSGNPLAQFQAANFTKEDFLKLLSSINNAAAENERVSDAVIQISFERGWGELEKAVKSIVERNDAKSPKKENIQVEDVVRDQVLQEIVSNSRSILRLIASPSEILPLDYVRHVFDEVQNYRKDQNLPFDHAVWTELDLTLARLSEKLRINTRDEDSKSTKENSRDVLTMALSLEQMILYIKDELYGDKIRRSRRRTLER